MWDRKDLKEKGKAKFRANRITCILAALLLMLTGAMAGSGSSIGSAVGANLGSRDNDTYVDEYQDDFIDDDYLGDEFLDEDEYFDQFYPDDELTFDDSESLGNANGYYQESIGDSSLPAIFGVVFAGILVGAIAVGSLLAIFLLNPLQVGLRKFFIDNASDPSTGLNRNTIGIGFNSNYMNIVGSMFTTNLFVFLWSLLLVFPGVIKGYDWRLVPYLLAENPDMKGSEARTISEGMMYGSKWKAFVLDISFIGWYLLGAVTLGISNLIWTHPYVAATDAELYLALSGAAAETTSEIIENIQDDYAAADEVEFIVE